MAAKEYELGGLHSKLAKTLSTLLDGTELPAEFDDEGTEVNSATVIPPSAAILTVAAKFLKDNNITCTPSKDNALGELEDKMRERAEKRAARKTASTTDLKAAGDDMSFMAGLPN